MDLVRVERLFQRLADLPADERAAVLDREAADDPELRRRVADMLEHLEADRSLAPPPLAGLSAAEGPGSVIGRYKLLQVIGEGGFGIVYMAEQQEPVRRKVALKVIKLGMDTREVVARFEAERQALALMDHPNIAKVLDGGATEAGRPYFVMELVRGVSVTEYCDTNQLDTRQRLDLFMDVALAVQHAHQKGVIHRDIKPSNVMVTLADGQPVPKVIDFGIAKAMHTRLTEKTLFTAYQRFVGTPTYMSPEQAEMSALDVDTRTDIYSLGVLLYELLTGTTPVDPLALRQAGFAEMQRVIREQRPPVPSQRISTTNDASVAQRRAADVPALSRLVRGDLDWIVMRALEKERARRYASANELVEDIRRHLRDEPVDAGPPSQVYRLRKFLARNRAGVFSATVVLISLVGGMVLATWFLLEATDQRRAAEQARQVAEAAGEQARRASELAEDQRQLAESQAAAAQEVTAFLVQTLSLTDPSVVLDPDLSVRTLLDRAAARLGSALADQPAAEAAVRDTIGHAYVALGEQELAEPHLRRAVALLDEAGSDDLATLYDLLWTLTGVAFNVEASDAWPLARRARDTGHAHIRADHPLLADALDAFVASVEMRDVTVDSAGLFRAAVRRAQLDLEPGDPLWLIVSDSYLAAAYTLWYSPAEAASEAFLREVLVIRRRELPENHPGISEALNQLVGVMTRDGRAAEAEGLIRDSLDRLQRVHGEETFPVAFARATLAANLVTQGRYAEAEPHALSSHATIRSKRGPTNFFSIDSLQRLVGLYQGWGRPEQADVHRAELSGACAGASVLPEWPLSRLAFPPGLVPLLDQIGEACGGVDYGARSAWRDDTGLEPLLDALFGARRDEWADDPDLSRLLGRTLVAWAGNLRPRAGGARERLTAVALELLEPAAADLPADLAECLALEAGTRGGEAGREMARRAHQLVSRTETLNTWITANARTRVARELIPLGLHDEARELLEGSLARLLSLFGRGNADCETTLETLAALEEAAGRPERARALREG